MAKVMTKERKEQLSNRLVLNFGILLGAALIMLYVFNALRSSFANTTFLVLLVLGIVGVVGAVVFFVLGKLKYPKMKNYSAVFLGVAIGCALLYLSKFSFIPYYSKTVAVVTVYIAMAVYFIVLAIITSVQLRKPVVEEKAAQELDSRRRRKKKKKKK